MQTATLNGSWEFRCLGEDRWLDVTVPGGVYGDLHAAGATDHPYDRDNELDVQWVGTSDWEYRRTIMVDEVFLDHERVVLQCDGLDTVATIAVNGETVGTSENMHRQHEFDVADVLTTGENEIRVTFRSPVEYANEQADKHPYEIPTLRYPVDQPSRNFIRKAQCHFGWDWGPCLPTVGIWRDIRLVAHTTPRISYVTPIQCHTDSDDVGLGLRVGLDVPTAGEYTITGIVAETSASVSRQYRLESSGEVELSMTVEDPDLWWPAGHGEQPLYELSVSVEEKNDRSEKRERNDGHRVTNRLGFRDVELIREPDADGVECERNGESFYLQVNGEPIFARGANWIPADALNQNVTSERYDDLLSSAVDANMNTIRVWGGGYYERNEFYQLCDEKGLLVWQDFMFACALYPADDAFVESIEAEARYQVRRLSTHPSVGIWCGNNELEVGLESWFADSTHIADLESDYRTIFEEALGGVMEEEDPSRPYWSASPSSGGDLLDPETEDRGDIHYWGVWHEGKPFSAFLDTAPRFVSEFGYQSFPSEETLADVIPVTHRNPTAPLMEHHQRNEGGNKRILQRMGDHFRMPSRFEDFVYLSQLQQGVAIQTAVEHWRRSKPHCMGTIYWQLNDLWQCASWSSIEYGGGWKALHYMARRFYEPVHTSMVERDEGNTLDVWVTSDERESVSGSVTVAAVTMDGQRVFEERFDALLDKNESACVGTIDIASVLAGTPRSDVLFSAQSDGLGSSPTYHVLVPYKQLSITDTDLSVSVADGSVTVRASEAALFVELDSDIDGRFSDNYFHLAPNETRTIDYVCDETLSDRKLSETLSVTHLAKTY